MDRVCFGPAFAGLMTALGDRRTPEVVNRLRQVGFDPEGPLLPAYPIDAYLGAMRVIADARWPGQPLDDQMYELGRGLLRGYAQTLVGKALLPLLKLIGPERALQRMTRSIRTTNNYTETRLESLGPGHSSLWISPVYFPGYYRGVLAEGFALNQVPGAEVQLADRQGESARFEIRWSR
jgi:uncharacterized protein (TIGR02265 family)